MIFSSCCSGLFVSSSDLNKYKQAYEYIQNDTLAVNFVNKRRKAREYSDYKLEKINFRINNYGYNPSFLFFYSDILKRKLNFELNNRMFYYDSSLIQNLVEFRESQNKSKDEEIEICPELIQGKISLKSEKATITFSNVEGNYLTAYICEYDASKDDGSSSYWCNEAIEYLFVFKDDKLFLVIYGGWICRGG